MLVRALFAITLLFVSPLSLSQSHAPDTESDEVAETPAKPKDILSKGCLGTASDLQVYLELVPGEARRSVKVGSVFHWDNKEFKVLQTAVNRLGDCWVEVQSFDKKKFWISPSGHSAEGPVRESGKLVTSDKAPEDIQFVALQREGKNVKASLFQPSTQKQHYMVPGDVGLGGYKLESISEKPDRVKVSKEGFVYELRLGSADVKIMGGESGTALRIEDLKDSALERALALCRLWDFRSITELPDEVKDCVQKALSFAPTMIWIRDGLPTQRERFNLKNLLFALEFHQQAKEFYTHEKEFSLEKKESKAASLLKSEDIEALVEKRLELLANQPHRLFSGSRDLASEIERMNEPYQKKYYTGNPKLIKIIASELNQLFKETNKETPEPNP